MKNVLFPDWKIIETDYFKVEQDWEVPIPWFFILSSKKITKSISDFTDIEAQDFIMLLRKVRLWMKNVLDIKDIGIYQNEATEHNFPCLDFPTTWTNEKFDYKKIQSIFPIMNYAKEHMATEDVIKEVRWIYKKWKNIWNKQTQEGIFHPYKGWFFWIIKT